MKENRFNLTLENLNDYPWQDLIEAEKTRTCDAYSAAFNQAYSKLNKSNDETGSQVYRFLAIITSFHCQYENSIEPYGPLYQGADGKRSLIPDDLSDQDLNLLESIIDDIKDPEFRARIADILWVIRKDYKAAQIAILAFIKSAEQLESPEIWTYSIDRLRRAARIASFKGFEAQKVKLIQFVEVILKKYQHNNNLASLSLLEILFYLNTDNNEYYGKISESIAKRLAKIKDWNFAKKYWILARDFHKESKSESDTLRCLQEAAECDINHANEIIKNGGPSFSASQFMKSGLELLKRAGEDPQRIREIHGALLDIQKSIPKEMTTIEFSDDEIPGLEECRQKSQQDSREKVSGHSLEKAITNFVCNFDPLSLSMLKARDKEQEKEGFLTRFFGSSMLDSKGRTTDYMPGSLPGLGEDPNVTLKRLVQNARDIDWQVATVWKIEPMRLQILKEHSLRERDLLYLVLNNPFITLGHEGIYLRGIQAGFFGDWLLSMHLLVPQIETSIRLVLEYHNISTSHINNEGIQEDFHLNRLLSMKSVEDIFGEDIVFNLKGILTERFGHNLRNRIAHGLISENEFYSSGSVYLWALVIRLVYIGHTYANSTQTTSKNLS